MISAVSADAVAELVRAAQLAPSTDNCQPWRFAWDGAALDVFLDHERAESAIDVRNTATWMSLGAALLNIRLAASVLHLQLATALSPDAQAGQPVAKIRFEPSSLPADPLAPSIPQRATNRLAYRSAPLFDDDRVALLDTVEDSSVQLDMVVDPDALGRAADLLAQFDQLLFEHPTFHGALFRWVRWTDDEARRRLDGLPVSTLGLSSLERTGFRALSHWPTSRTMAALGLTKACVRKTAVTYRRSAAIGALSVAQLEAESAIRAGVTLERIWLTATSRGLALQPMAGLVFLWLRCRFANGEGLTTGQQQLARDLAERMDALIPALRQRIPLIFFRTGQAQPPVARAPRRPVEAVLTVSHG